MRNVQKKPIFGLKKTAEKIIYKKILLRFYCLFLINLARSFRTPFTSCWWATRVHGMWKKCTIRKLRRSWRNCWRWQFACLLCSGWRHRSIPCECFECSVINSFAGGHSEFVCFEMFAFVHQLNVHLLQIGLPAFLYTIQNVILYYAASHLSATAFMVSALKALLHLQIYFEFWPFGPRNYYLGWMKGEQKKPRAIRALIWTSWKLWLKGGANTKI